MPPNKLDTPCSGLHSIRRLTSPSHWLPRWRSPSVPGDPCARRRFAGPHWRPPRADRCPGWCRLPATSLLWTASIPAVPRGTESARMRRGVPCTAGQQARQAQLCDAITCAAAALPCGTGRSTSNASPASTSVAPLSIFPSAPITWSGAARTGWPASRCTAGRSGHGRSGAAGSNGKSAARRRPSRTGDLRCRCASCLPQGRKPRDARGQPGDPRGRRFADDVEPAAMRRIARSTLVVFPASDVFGLNRE